MSDVTVTPHAGGWAVRHPRRLYERFDSRRDALRVAAAHAQQLAAAGEPCGVREARSFAPVRTPRPRD